MDGSKLAALGWQPRTSFEDGLAATVDWYRANEAWWRAARSGDWDAYYERQYGPRLATGQAAAAIDARRPTTDARRRHRGRRPARAGARGGPRRCAVHRPGRADRLDAATTSTSTRPTASARASIATGPRSSSTPRPGPTSTAAPAIPSWRSAATARDRRPRRGLRRARHRPARRLDQRGLRRRRGATAGRTAPTTRPSPVNPYGASKLAGERLRGRGVRGSGAGARSGSPGRRGCSGRRATTSRAGSSRPPSGRAAGEPLRLVGDEWGTPTYTADVADAIVELLAEDAVGGIHHLVNGGIATRADWARDVVARAGDRRSRSRTSRCRPGSAPRRRRAGASSRRRRCRPASRSGLAGRDGRLRAARSCARRRRREADDRRRRPPSALPGVRYGAIVRHADARGSFRELWRPRPALTARLVPADEPRSSRPTCRPRRRASCAACTCHRRQVDLWIVADGRAFVALVDVRPMLDGSARPRVVETRELAADEWVVIPTGVAHGFLAVEPLELIYSSRTSTTARDELGFAWDDPAVGGRLATLAATPGRTRRSCRTATGEPDARRPRGALMRRRGRGASHPGTAHAATLPGSVPRADPKGP